MGRATRPFGAWQASPAVRGPQPRCGFRLLEETKPLYPWSFIASWNTRDNPTRDTGTATNMPTDRTTRAVRVSANWRSFLETLDDSDRKRPGSLRCRGDIWREVFSHRDRSWLFPAPRLANGPLVHDDPQAVACTERPAAYLRATGVAIEQGPLGSEYPPAWPFDVVYCGRAPHGQLQTPPAVSGLVPTERPLCIASTDQGGAAPLHAVNGSTTGCRKRRHVAWRRHALRAKFALVRLAQGRNPLPLRIGGKRSKDRGMSAWHVGGLGGLRSWLPWNRSSFPGRGYFRKLPLGGGGLQHTCSKGRGDRRGARAWPLRGTKSQPQRGGSVRPPPTVSDGG